tara:strand:- start:11930 stop:12817 length:888 start_codon:yes stop_codon:yes gene_type:complete
MNLPTSGRHLIAEYRGCDTNTLNHLDAVSTLMQQAALAAGATIVNTAFHAFTPTGVSGVVLLKESHLSIHTWPEEGYAALDLYTCGDCDPKAAHHVLAHGLRSMECELMLLERGHPGMSMRSHRGVQLKNGTTQWSRETFMPDPTEFFVVSGSGEGNTALNAFDHALLDAGIGDTNLVRMSSIVPPKLTHIEKKPLPYGALVPVAYAEMTSDKPGAVISAAIAAAFPVDESLPGLIMEHHAEAPLEEVEATVRKMALDGMLHRKRDVRDVLVIGKEHTVETVGSAFAGLVLWSSM